MKKDFIKYLKSMNLSDNTICSYIGTIEMFDAMFKEVNKNNLLAFKGYLIERFKPKTVNLRIQAINKYLHYLNKRDLCLKSIKIQQKTFLENVISNADYKFLKESLRKDGKYEWYFLVRFLAATGARVSEIIQFKVEHVVCGYFDLYSKGGKIRRIYIPKKLAKDANDWLKVINKDSGYLFTNRNGERITTRGIGLKLKQFAKEYKIDPVVVYPHSFRHRFAKNFLEKFNDISLLADLMGHDSIETTRIYLRRTSTEQKEIVDKVITW